MTGELLCNMIEANKVEVGVDRNIFSLDFTLYQHLLMDTWIKDVWKIAYNHQIDIVDKTFNYTSIIMFSLWKSLQIVDFLKVN